MLNNLTFESCNYFLFFQVSDLFLFNPLHAELNPICHFLSLLEAHHILHVSRIRVNYVIKRQSMYVYLNIGARSCIVAVEKQ